MDLLRFLLNAYNTNALSETGDSQKEPIDDTIFGVLAGGLGMILSVLCIAGIFAAIVGLYVIVAGMAKNVIVMQPCGCFCDSFLLQF